MQYITGKFISGEGLGTPDYEATIELPEVNQENIKAGDTIWVEKVVPSSEPLSQFLKRHPKVVAHFQQQQNQQNNAELPEKFCVNPEDVLQGELNLRNQILCIMNKIDELIVFTQKLAER